MTIRMGLREANQKFSEAMKAVKAGADIVLTERGKAIAVIRRLREGSDPEEIVERLRTMGNLRAATAAGPMPPWKPKVIQGAAMAVTVQKARDER